MKENKVILPLLVSCIISSLAISNGNTPLAPSWLEPLKIIINYSICFWLLFATDWKIKNKITLLKISAILFWFILRVFHVHTLGSLDLVVTLSLIALVSTDGRILSDVLIRYKKFLVIITLLGLISYFDTFTGMNLPHTVVSFSDVDDSMGVVNDALYINHYFSYTLIQSDGIRLCSLFNEPGYYGTIVAFMLIISGFKFNNIGNIVLLVGGILSLSMAFFILLGIGLFLFGLKNLKYRVLLFFIVVFVVFLLPNLHFESEIVNNLFYRFKFDTQTMSFVGDDRSNDGIDMLYNQFINSSNILFGYGTGYCNTFMEGACTYKKFIIEWGYIGSLLTYGLIIISSFLESIKKREAVYYSFCFMVSIYQRPSIFTMAYLLVLYGGIYYIKNHTNALVPHK